MDDILMGMQLIETRRHGDDRGWFIESYSQRDLAARGIFEPFVQDNQSLSRAAYTLRGLHFQAAPCAQSKLVRCLRGRIWDVVVDLRDGSPDQHRWKAVELSANNALQLYVPEGFAHGFLTLEADCEVAYKVSSPYSARHDGGVRWNDPTLAIDWPLPPGIDPLLSDKDRHLPLLADLACSQGSSAVAG